MIRHRLRITALVGAVCLLAVGCATKPPQAAVGETQKLAKELADRKPGAVISAGAIEPMKRLEFKYNTSSWSYESAIELDRDLIESIAAAPDLAVSAPIAKAYNQAALNRLVEASISLDDAEVALAATTALTPADKQVQRVNLLIARAVIAGDRAAGLTGAAARAAYEDSAKLAEKARTLASAGPLAGAGADGASTSEGPRQSGDTVVLSAGDVAPYNNRAREGVGRIITATMTAPEKLAVLKVRADYADAAALLALGRVQDAADVNAEAVLAMKGFRKSFDWLQVRIDYQRAQLLASRNHLPEAELILREAITNAQKIEGRSRFEAFLWRALAEMQAERGDAVDAESSQQNSFDILSDQADGVWPSRGDVAPYLAQLAPKAAHGDGAATARLFAVASVATETETASTLTDVAARFATADTAAGAAIRRLQFARYEVKAAAARRARVESPASNAKPADIAAAREEDEAARARLLVVAKESAQTAGPKAGAVLSPRTELTEVQTALRLGEAYVRFVFLDDGSGYAIAVTKTAAHVAALPADRKTIDKDVAAIRLGTALATGKDGATTVPPFRATAAAELYQVLFSGSSDAIGGATTLIIEPAGSLYSLPFAALLTQPLSPEVFKRVRDSGAKDYSGAQWLGRDRTIELSVGSKAFVRLRAAAPSAAPRAILAFADPLPAEGDPGTVDALVKSLSGQRAAKPGVLRISNVANADVAATGPCYDEAKGILVFPRLKETVTEARAAIGALHGDPDSSLVQGAAFNDVDFASNPDLDKYRVLLFSTHAALPVLDPGAAPPCWPNPFLLATRVSNPLSEGVLDAVTISGLTLNADLVVLAACDTGDTAGKGPAGQALGGLAQSFLVAGSRGVIVSHWDIASLGATSLMTDMFGAMGGGDPPEKALAKAERKLMDSQTLSHPYYWAPFTLVGGSGGS